jgi:hypothetical protein
MSTAREMASNEEVVRFGPQCKQMHWHSNLSKSQIFPKIENGLSYDSYPGSTTNIVGTVN